MIVPIPQVQTILEQLYYGSSVRVLNSTFIYVQGVLNSWSPHIMIGTRRNLVIANFNPKDDKYVKIFNRREARIVEYDDERVIKNYANVMKLTINQDEFIVKFLSQHDQLNWTFFIQSGFSPVFQICLAEHDAYHNEGLFLALNSVDNKYFSEIRLCDLPMHELQYKRSVYLYLGALCKLLTEHICSPGLLLNEGNLVYRFFNAQNAIYPSADRFVNIFNKLYVDLSNVYKDEKEIESRYEKIMKRKYVYSTRNWNQQYYQCLRYIYQLYAQYAKHYLPGEMTGSIDLNKQGERLNLYDMYDPVELDAQAIEKLRHAGYSYAKEDALRRIGCLDNFSLTEGITALLTLFREFREHCEKVVQTMVEEFVLPTHEQEFLDVDVWRNPLAMDYLLKVYAKQYEQFYKACGALDQMALQRLEDMMTQFGPVHGSIMGTLGQMLRQYQQLMMQPKTFVAGTRLSSPPPGPGDDPVFEYGPQNGFPDGLIETTLDGFVYSKSQMVYPNQLAPAYEVNNGGVTFKFAVDKSGHSQLNVRRDSYMLANRDNIVIDQAHSEMAQMQALYDGFFMDNIEEQLKIPMCCVVKFCGFSVYCTADINEQTLAYGYYQNGQFRDADDSLFPVLKASSSRLNIEPHLIVASPASQRRLFDTPVEVAFVLSLSENLRQFDGYERFASFLRDNAVDISAQIGHLKAIRLDEQRNLISVQLSALLQVFEDGAFYARNLQALALPDLPTEFVKNVLPLLTAQTTKRSKSGTLLEDKLAYISQTCRLPAKYTRLIDEKYNPDACLLGLKVTYNEVGLLTEQLKAYFNKVSAAGSVDQLDKALFGRFIACALCDFYYTYALYQSQRWSDLYRLQYLPLLMNLLDQEIASDALCICEVPSLFRHFYVPLYLWLFTANLSQFSEVMEVVRIAVAAAAISRYLDDSLRRLRRSIYQYGIPEAFVLQLDPVAEKKKDKRAQMELYYLLNLEAKLFQASNKMEAMQTIELLKLKRMNFFTAQTKEDRLAYAEQYIKQYIAQFLNSVFSLNESSLQTWQNINSIIYNFYHEHSFAEEYTKKLRGSYMKDEMYIADFVQVAFSPKTLFRDSASAENGGLGVNYRLLLLDQICSLSGIVINDLNTYVFTQTNSIFRYSDIISCACETKIPLPQFVTEICNVPYRSWLGVALRVEALIANSFSFRINYYDGNAQRFYLIYDQFVLRHYGEIRNRGNQIFRQFHYNVAFSKISNLTSTRQFENLLRSTARTLSAGIRSQFAALFKAESIEKSMPLIRRYTETLETVVVLISAALGICRRNSAAGMAVYKTYMYIMNDVAEFYAELKRFQPSILLTIYREIIYNESIFNDYRLLPRFVMESEATQMAMLACKNILRQDSVECVKLLMAYAAHHYAMQEYEAALELLYQAEATTVIRNKDKCDFLLEIQNFKGMSYNKLGLIAKAYACFTEAKNIHQYHIDCSKRKLTKLVSYKERLENNLYDYERQEAIFSSALRYNFAYEDANEILTEFNNYFAMDDEMNRESGDAFSDPRGSERTQALALMARLTLERLSKQEQVFYAESIQAYDLLLRTSNGAAASCIAQAMNTLEQRLAHTILDHDKSFLFLSYIIENEALLYINYQDVGQLSVGRKLAIEALRMRKQVLSPAHSFTLKALYTISEFDGKMRNSNKQITSLEFILRSLDEQILEDLNPVAEERIDRLSLFKKLANCVFATLSADLQRVVAQGREIAGRRKDFGLQLVMSTVRKICESDNIANSIFQVVVSAGKEMNKYSVSDLVYLLKCVADDIPVRSDMEFNSQGGVDRGIYDLVEAIQVKGMNYLARNQLQEGLDEEEDW